MRNLRLKLEYDGTGFAGWQLQPEQRTIQGELQAAILKLTGEKIAVCAAGRTDAGVHALGQVVNFYTASNHPPQVFVAALNSLLPDDVAVIAAADAPDRWNAKVGARGKWYRYLLRDGRRHIALDRFRVWRLPHCLDLAAMQEAAAALIGEHDFSAFRSASCESTSPVKEMRRIEIFRDLEGRVVIDFWASAFLKQMARTITGTLVEVGLNRRPASAMAAILSSRDRRKAGQTAPAHGLYLLRVDYEEDI